MNKIQFTWHGKSYAMTADEIEAAYRHQLHTYRMQDAERHVNNLVFDVTYSYADHTMYALVIDKEVAGLSLHVVHAVLECRLLPIDGNGDTLGRSCSAKEQQCAEKRGEELYPSSVRVVSYCHCFLVM